MGDVNQDASCYVLEREPKTHLVLCHLCSENSFQEFGIFVSF